MKTSQKGTIGTLMNQYDIMLKLMGQLISDPNPSRKSKASDPGYLESDLYECRDFDILEDIKKMKPKIKPKGIASCAPITIGATRDVKLKA